VTQHAHTLLARLAGPLQSWGTTGRFAYRDTHAHPTKSAFVGMLAAALGREREDDITDLAALRFAVRADRPGTPIRDFHIVGGGSYPLRPRDLITDDRRQETSARPRRAGEGEYFGLDAGFTPARWYGAPKGVAPDPANGVMVASNTRRNPIITYRWYLADAAFVAAVQSDKREKLEELAAALEQPKRFIWLGRKSCPPAGEVCGGVYEGSLEEVLAQTKPLAGANSVSEPWTWIETEPGTPHATIVNDQPLTFNSLQRAYAPRWEKREYIPPGETIGWEHLL